MDTLKAVSERYSEGARQRTEALCCPVDYDARLLEMLPREIVERDYGCGDPSRYVREGDTVLDLGSGSGKICYMAAQLTGPEGYVIGVDMNDEMLALARRYQGEMAERLGGDRVRFCKGRIEDLALDLEAAERWLAAHPVSDGAGLAAFEDWCARERRERPMVADASVDLVISNCVLNLVRDDAKEQLVREIHRVVRPGGRIAISDIVADEPIPERLKKDPELWSGCISGAFVEQEFVDAFAAVGFEGVAIDQWADEPWQVIEGIEFRAVTVTAVKPVVAPCVDQGHAVIYRGPFAEVVDDEGHRYPRGARMAVCARTYDKLTSGPWASQFIAIAPAVARDPQPWCPPADGRRPPAESKGADHRGKGVGGGCC